MIQRSLVVLVLLGVASGCLALQRASARSSFIEQRTAEHIYDQPLRSVWPSARQVLFEQGFQVRDTGEGGFTLETDWKYKPNSRERYLVQGIELDSGRCRIQVTRLHAFDTSTHATSRRDLDMEWKILRRVDPASAQNIEADADGHANRAG